MSNIFDLEQQIMRCWTITEDLDSFIKVLEETIKPDSMSEKDFDTITNIIVGLKSVYEMHFESLFDIFESCLTKRGLSPVSDIMQSFPDLERVVCIEKKKLLDMQVKHTSVAFQDSGKTLKIFFEES